MEIMKLSVYSWTFSNFEIIFLESNKIDNMFHILIESDRQKFKIIFSLKEKKKIN